MLLTGLSSLPRVLVRLRAGCPESSKAQPDMNFSCRERIWASLMAQKMARNVNTAYVYSDLRSALSWPTLPFVITNCVRPARWQHDNDGQRGGPRGAA